MESMGFVVTGSLAGRGGFLGAPSSSTCPKRSRGQVGGVRRRSTLTMKSVGEVSKDSFQGEVMESDLPVLVDFYAAWCGPCKLIAPVMDWCASEYEGKLRVVKIDTEKYPNFVREYSIHGLPTLAIFKNGENISQIEGAIGKQKVLDLLNDNLPELSS